MRSTRLGIVILLLVCVAGGFRFANGQSAERPALGYAARKPVFGGACPLCPWGSMANVVKAAMKPYGWDIQICYVCAGGARSVRMVSGKQVPPIDPESTTQPNPPQAPLDLGATGTERLWWAYQGRLSHKEDGPHRDLRLIANIAQPAYYMVAVRKGTGITDLRQIREKRLKVKFMQTGIQSEGVNRLLDYFNLSRDIIEKDLGGELVGTGPESRENLDVIAGWVSLVAAPEFSYWLDIAQHYDLEFLELPKDLLETWAREGNYEVKMSPPGLLPGLENRSIPSVAKSGSVVYGRADMPAEFAYTLAKALDEQQDLFQWTHMNWSYNWRTVWKAFGVPLHPGAEKYYREVGYMK